MAPTSRTGPAFFGTCFEIGYGWYKSQLCVYFIYFIHINYPMRTNIVIDDELMKQVLKLTGLKTKREAVEQGLKTLVRLKQQEQIRKYRGKLNWEGDLDDMRRD